MAECGRVCTDEHDLVLCAGGGCLHHHFLAAGIAGDEGECECEAEENFHGGRGSNGIRAEVT